MGPACMPAHPSACTPVDQPARMTIINDHLRLTRFPSSAVAWCRRSRRKASKIGDPCMGSPRGGACQVDNGPQQQQQQQQQQLYQQRQQPAGGSVELAPPAPSAWHPPPPQQPSGLQAASSHQAPAAAAAATEARREQEPPLQLPAEKRLRLARAPPAATAAGAAAAAVAMEAHPGAPPPPPDASDMALDVRPGSGGVPGGVQNCDEIFSFPRNCLALPGGCGGVALPGSGGDAAAVQPPPTWQGSCSPA